MNLFKKKPDAKGKMLKRNLNPKTLLFSLSLSLSRALLFVPRFLRLLELFRCQQSSRKYLWSLLKLSFLSLSFFSRCFLQRRRKC
jgi:hypothetical protein